MSQTNIQQTQVVNEPELKDLLDLLKKDIFLNMNVHHIGTIQSFNSANQTVTATINYKKTFFQLNTSTNLYDPVLIDYPILVDCPAIVLGGGSGSLTFPIAQGDECLVLFNDRDIDNWFANGGGGALATPRLHSFADGLVLIGIRSLANSLENYDTSRAVLRYGDPVGGSGAMVGVGTTLVKIANNTTTLNTLLQSLITQIKLITVPVAGVQTGGGAVVSGIPVNAAALTSIATQIQGLLE